MKHDKFNAVLSEYEDRMYERVFSGRMTQGRLKLLNDICNQNTDSFHCSCEHDCCGCLVSIKTTFTYIHNQVTVTLVESLNY